MPMNLPNMGLKSGHKPTTIIITLRFHIIRNSSIRNILSEAVIANQTHNSQSQPKQAAGSSIRILHVCLNIPHCHIHIVHIHYSVRNHSHVVLFRLDSVLCEWQPLPGVEHSGRMGVELFGCVLQKCKKNKKMNRKYSVISFIYAYRLWYVMAIFVGYAASRISWCGGWTAIVVVCSVHCTGGG